MEINHLKRRSASGTVNGKPGKEERERPPLGGNRKERDQKRENPVRAFSERTFDLRGAACSLFGGNSIGRLG